MFGGVCARIGYSGHKSYHSDLNPLMRGQNVQGNGILLRRDQARIKPGLGQIQTLLPSAWLGLRNLTDERPSEDKPGLGQIKTLLPPAWPGLRNLIVERPSEDKPGLGLINKVLPTAWTKWPGQRNFTADWLSEDKTRAWAGQHTISFCVDRLNR